MSTERPIDELVAMFLAGTLPRAEWTHRAHLRVGLWHAIRFDPAETLNQLRNAIRNYNESVGVANTLTSGYHETITRFYVAVIHRFLNVAGRKRPIEQLAEELIANHGDPKLPLTFWSRDRLMSADARCGWLEPDLKAFDPFELKSSESER